MLTLSTAVPKMELTPPTIDPQFSSPRRNFVYETAAMHLQRNSTSGPSVPPNSKEPLALLLQTFQDMTERTQDFWWRAANYFERREYKQGTILYARGDQPDGFYLLQQGILRADYELEQGSYQESIVSGTTCGELPFFSETNRTATVVAEKDCVTWLLTEGNWRKMEKELPDVAREILVVCLKLTSERMSAITSSVLPDLIWRCTVLTSSQIRASDCELIRHHGAFARTEAPLFRTELPEIMRVFKPGVRVQVEWVDCAHCILEGMVVGWSYLRLGSFTRASHYWSDTIRTDT